MVFYFSCVDCIGYSANKSCENPVSRLYSEALLPLTSSLECYAIHIACWRLLSRSLKFCSSEVALHLYKSTKRPCMKYSDHVWDAAQKKLSFGEVRKM